MNLLDKVPNGRYVRLRPKPDGTYHLEKVGVEMDEVRAGTDTEIWYKTHEGRMERLYLAYSVAPDGSQYDVWSQPRPLSRLSQESSTPTGTRG